MSDTGANARSDARPKSPTDACARLLPLRVLIDGLEATRRLKADPDTADIPIIALTAHALASDQQKAMEAGCDGYILKPAEPRLVLATVKRYLGEAVAA